MSDGGGKSGIKFELQKIKKRLRGNEFAPEIAKIAVAQICESEGFQSFQQSALETLSDVAVRYIRNIGKTANFHANLAGRTDSNIFDIILGLEDLGSAQGFSGASDINNCVSNSGIVKEISQYTRVSEEIPFVYDVPQFPAIKEQKPVQSFLQTEIDSPAEHIPAWLPAFPYPLTFVNSSTQNENSKDIHDDKIQKRQHRKEEPLNSNLQHRIVFNGSEGGPSMTDPVDAAKLKQAVESNPFLAAPLGFGEKEASSIDFLARPLHESVLEYPVTESRVLENQISVLDTFAPAMEAMKNNSCDSMDGGQNGLLNKRPTVQFKIGVREKSLGSTVDLISHRQGAKKVSTLFGKDNEKDDKKRRAEQILKESMENHKELAEL